MKKLGWVGVVVAAMLLSGCSATGDVEAETAPPATAEKTTAPLAVDEAPAETDNGDAQFLAAVRERVAAISEASDEQLIAAGQSACEALAAGTDILEIRLIDGEEPDADGWYKGSMSIAGEATLAYCPELG